MKNKIYNEIFVDIEENNIKGFIELIDFYKKRNDYNKIYEIKNNNKCFYEYIKSRNRVLKQKFELYEYVNNNYL